jgi:ribosome-associated protein
VDYQNQVGERTLESNQVARAIVDTAVARLAADTLLLDVRGLTLIADYFVICTGSTERQVNAIVESIRTTLKEQGVRSNRVEGSGSSGWMLLDYSDVIVHAMTPAVRELYDLEGLWKEAKTVIRIE